MTPDRLAELATLLPDCPDDARLNVPARDLRDLVRLVPVVLAAMHWNDDEHTGGVTELIEALEAMRSGGGE